MDEDYISIQNGDRFTVENDVDGRPAIKIQNTVWVEGPRWLLFGSVGGKDRRAEVINELIEALIELRDAKEQTS